MGVDGKQNRVYNRYSEEDEANVKLAVKWWKEKSLLTVRDNTHKSNLDVCKIKCKRLMLNQGKAGRKLGSFNQTQRQCDSHTQTIKKIGRGFGVTSTSEKQKHAANYFSENLVCNMQVVQCACRRYQVAFIRCQIFSIN